MHHDLDLRAQFRMIHGAGEILQDQPTWGSREAIVERLHVLSAAAATVHEQYAVLIACCGLVAIEDLLLYGEPIGEDGTVLAASCHEGVEVSEDFGVLFDIVPEAEICTESVMYGCSEAIGGASVACFLKIGGHFWETLEGVVEAEG